MKREEAIKHLEEWKEVISNSHRKEVIDMAIEALKQEPVCEHFYKGYCSRFEDGCFRQCQAEPKHGEWIEERNITTDGKGYTAYRCSVCQCAVLTKLYNFCPNCGAKMKGVADK